VEWVGVKYAALVSWLAALTWELAAVLAVVLDAATGDPVPQG